MWCCRCQQDVPAAAEASGKAKCPRCRGLLIPPTEARATALVSDCGLELDAYRSQSAERLTGAIPSPSAAPAWRAAPSPRPEQLCSARTELQRIERKLRLPRGRSDAAGDDGYGGRQARAVAIWRDADGGEAECLADSVIIRTGPAAPAPTWGVSLLLAAGATALMCGVSLLVAANVLVHAAAWRWGFAATITGEGLLIGGLTALAARLWRNSRRMKLQLDGIDCRLGEMQTTLAGAATGATAGALRGALRRLELPAA